MEGLRVYVGGLPQNTTEQDLEHFFEGFGTLKEIIIRKRFAFVEFDDRKHAEDAIFDKDGEELLGVRVTVRMARATTTGRYQSVTSSEDGNATGGNKNGPLRTEYRVIVKNLASSVRWQTLKDFMREAAPVVYADVDRLLPNEGIVEFASYSGMKVAIEKLDGTELYGRQIRLVEDVRATSDCSPPSRRSRSRTVSADSDSSFTESFIESGSVTLSPYSDSGHSRSRSHSRSRTLSAYSDISSYTCFSSRRRCMSVCSGSRSRTVSAFSNTSCGPWFRARSQYLPGHSYSSHSISVGSRSRTLSAYTDGSRTLSCYGNRSRSLSSFSDGSYSLSRSRSRSFSDFSDSSYSISRSRSRTLSADSNGSRSRSLRNSGSFRGRGSRTPSPCSRRRHSRSRSGSRSHFQFPEFNFDAVNSESCRPSRPRRFDQIRFRSRPCSANPTRHESRSKYRKKSRKRRGSRSYSAIPAKRFLLDDIL